MAAVAYAPRTPANWPAEAKRLATAQAVAAMHRMTLSAIEGDNGRMEYILSRGALCKRFELLDQVIRYLDEIAGAQRL